MLDDFEDPGGPPCWDGPAKDDHELALRTWAMAAELDFGFPPETGIDIAGLETA